MDARNNRLPPWIRIRIGQQGKRETVDAALRNGCLNTVCESAQCPNRQECYSHGTATFMILGDTCSRDCAFCAVRHGHPEPVDSEEPSRVADAAAALDMRHVVLTSVTRDDLPDGGAELFARTIEAIRIKTGATVEVLTPDFLGNRSAIDRVLDAAPEVYNHNIETVRRLQPDIRPQADYDRSMLVLRHVAESGKQVIVKSGLMLGLGENDDEAQETIHDLYAAGCRALTIGQYLAPSRNHYPVQRFVTPEMFDFFRKQAIAIGFRAVASAPLVRSSYMAREMLERNSLKCHAS